VQCNNETPPLALGALPVNIGGKRLTSKRESQALSGFAPKLGFSGLYRTIGGANRHHSVTE
jgi:hypothetical protein